MHSFIPPKAKGFSFFFILLFTLTIPEISYAQHMLKVKSAEDGGTAFTGIDNHETWNTATYELQEAINQVSANGGGTIWVAGGAYLPTEYLAAAPDAPNPPLQDPADPNSSTDERQLSFIMASEVTVIGGFSGVETSLEERPEDLFGTENKVTLSGDIGIEGQTEDNAYHVVIFPPEADNTAILRDVEVTGGYANGPDAYFAKTGAGVHIREGGILQECLVINNVSEGSGGGVYLYKGGIAKNCLIKDNSATVKGGGVYSNLGGTVSYCDISRNTAGNTISEGKGGGIFLSADETQEGTITHCHIYANNSTNKGGGLATYGGGQIINNYIGNNGAKGKGGGIYLQVGGLVLNNTVVSNHGDRGAAVFCSDGGLVYNTVMWGNTTPYSSNIQLSMEDNTSTTQSPLIDFCAIENGTSSSQVTNLTSLSSENSGTDLHPEFISPVSFSGVPPDDSGLEEIQNSNYQFNLNSILLDAGKPDLTGLSVPEFDLVNAPRITKSVIDIGAFEAIYYNVTGNVNGNNGSISPDATQKVKDGAEIDFILSPDDGYEITNFTINDIDQLDNITNNGDYYSYTQTNISADLEAVVEYSIPNSLDSQNKNELKIFPVPARERLNFKGISVIGLKIFSTNGQLVLQSSNINQNQVNVSELPSGIYFLVITDANQNTISSKFVKQ